MPVNKLWLEHTERAAWESVEALRTKLAEAEARIERMAPPATGWRELFDALDTAKQSQTMDGATYADLVRGLLDRLADAQARAAVTGEELARLKSLGLPAMATHASPSRARDSEPGGRYREDSEEAANETERFLHAVEHRCRGLLREPGSTELDDVLRAVEAQVDLLSELEEPGIAEAAVELAALAARLAVVARRDARAER